MRPEQQRKGVGQALMAWGLKRTDELGLESYIEATAAGRKLYERCGYRVVARVDVNISRNDRGEAWRSLEDRILPSGYDSMWRSVNGVWENGSYKKRGPVGYASEIRTSSSCSLAHAIFQSLQTSEDVQHSLSQYLSDEA